MTKAGSLCLNPLSCASFRDSPSRRQKSSIACRTTRLLQSYIWQDYDVHPRFPKLRTFLDFWTRNLDGKLFGVRVAHKKLITPAELRFVGGEFRVH